MLNAGEAYLAPRSVWHGDSVFIGDDEYGECWILDVFAPPRPDLRPRAESADGVSRTLTGDWRSTSAARSPTSCCSTPPAARWSSTRR